MFADSLYEIITGTGTGNLALTGITRPSFRCSLAAVGTGNSFLYDLRHPENLPGTGITEWEIGIATITESSPGSMTGTMTRDVLASSNSNNPVNFTAGTKVLTSQPSAALLERLYELWDSNWANLQHSHESAGEGGTLDAAAIASGVISPDRLPQDLRTTAAVTFASEILAQSADSDLVFLDAQNTSAGTAAVTTARLKNSAATAELLLSVFAAAHASFPNVVLLYAGSGRALSFGADGLGVDMQLSTDGDLLLGTTTKPTANAGKAIVLGDKGNTPTLAVGTVGIWNDDGSLYIGAYGESPINLTAMQDVSVTAKPLFLGLQVGSNLETPATGSVVSGKDSTDRGLGNSYVQSSGKFSVAGDSQFRRVIVRTQTLNNTSKALTTDGAVYGASNQIVLPNFSLFVVKAFVGGKRMDTDGEVAGYIVSAVVHRGATAASTAIKGLVAQEILNEDDASWDVTLFADTTYGAIQVVVNGANGKTIDWTASVETVELVG